ncbi:MAG: PKD domain-containing protein [Actinobacteria bacterium]|nr:PKD domain-containing protein [Actinomycetota bacterium]
MTNNDNVNQQGNAQNNNSDNKKDDEGEEKKKNKKIFIVIGVAVGIVIVMIVLILLLFTFCRRGVTETEGTAVETTEAVLESEETETLQEEISTESEETSAESEESTEETTAEETTDEEETTSEEEAIAPTIALVIYMGPIYSPADGVCYYRVQANVTGTPAPTIVWSRSDSGTAWGPNRVQINLHSPMETYTLIATATNPAGSQTARITLSWGCNRPPTVHEITLMGDHIINTDYTVSAYATDPDGDVLTYQWSVTGGSIANPNINPMIWTTPSTPGFYDITVTANDGRGGTDSLTETVEVTKPNRPPVLGEIVITPRETTPPNTYYTGKTYDVSVPASDPDGDPLYYSWSISPLPGGGTFSNPNINPTAWTTNLQGNYRITVNVNDGRRGTAIKYKDVYVQVYSTLY